MKKTFIGTVATMLAAVFIIGCDSQDTEAPAETVLTGTVVDENEGGIGDARVSLGDASAVTDNAGVFTLEKPAMGAGTLTVEARYFEKLEKQVEIVEGSNAVEVSLATLPYRVTESDRALAESHNADFDWTEDTVSVDIVAAATRARIERAIYHHNPALYRDDSTEAPLAPAEPPSLAQGQAAGFDFPVDVEGGPVSAFDTTAIFDTADAAGLSAQTLADAMAWDPAIKQFLLNWDLAAANPLYEAGNAVESQRWGGSSVLEPQEIEELFVQDGALYAEVTFRGFLTLGEGITDSDGDGRAEVYAKINPELYTQAVVAKLEDDYIGKTYTVLELRAAVEHIRSDLYSETNPQLEAALGESFEAEGVGIFEYPAVVLSHANSAVNVLLIEP